VIRNEPRITPELVAEHGLKPDEYERVRKLIDEAKTNYREAKGDVGFNLFD